jgi:hypothetical protein
MERGRGSLRGPGVLAEPAGMGHALWSIWLPQFGWLGVKPGGGFTMWGVRLLGMDLLHGSAGCRLAVI